MNNNNNKIEEKTIGELVKEFNITVNRKKLPSGNYVCNIENIDPKTLKIDTTFQRELNPSHAKNIGQKFSVTKMKIPNGFRYKGSVYLTDGQHTAAGAVLSGHKKIPVYIVDIDATSRINNEEYTHDDIVNLMSQQFTSLNTTPKRVSLYDTHKNFVLQATRGRKVGLTPDEEKKIQFALEVDEIVTQNGFYFRKKLLRGSSNAGAITHVKNIYNSYSLYKKDATVKTLKFMKEFWPNDPVKGALVVGFARFFKYYIDAEIKNVQGISFDRKVLFKSLTYDGSLNMDETYDELVRFSRNVKFKGNVSFDVWICQTMVAMYNHYIETNNIGLSPLKTI